METIFLKLLNMSIAAGWLIIAAAIIRLLIKRAPKWITCALWALVAVRLSCPFALESTFSLIPHAETIYPIDSLHLQNSTLSSGVSSYTDSSFADNSFIDSSFADNFFAVSASAPTLNADTLHTLLPIASLIWVAGFCITILYALIGFLRMHHRVQEAVPLQDALWICDAVQSPFILGLLRPRIYLPSTLEQNQLPYVLAHEQAHLKRHDHWWKFLGYILLAIYWFHPLVWLAYILFCRDIELACDERVIRIMDFSEKKAYSAALVSCSMPRQVMAISPLAFGEIGVKERVKTVLSYKKPTFWMAIIAVITCIIVAVCFLTNPRTDVFDIKIVVPAGSTQPFHYSDMELSPTKNQIILSSGEGLGDTEVVLKTVEVHEENAYEPTYMTPGLSVKMYAEKGAWFQIGVAISNPTDEDIVVYVHVENVNVRARSKTSDPDDSDIQYDKHPMVLVNNMYYYDTGRESTRTDRSEEMTGRITSEVDGWEIPLENDQSNFGAGYYYQLIDNNTLEIYVNGKWTVFEANHKTTENELNTPPADAASNDVHSTLTAAIVNAIRTQNPSPDNSDFACCDFVTLEKVYSADTATCYGWALYQNYHITENGIEDLGGSHIPIILTFLSGENNYQLIEYWQPREGSFYVSDIRAHFPAHIVDDALNSQKYIVQQTQSCYRQAVEFSGLDTDSAVENLLDTLCSDPKASSNPHDYIDANPLTYRELIYYGEYTLRYCLNRFLDGNETGLEGKIMAILCEELLQTKGQLSVDADDAATGQRWYEALMAHDQLITQKHT